ncbi:MAG: hypothetical protein Ct9H90mP22_4150 [Gammaproteobacteria bacterium]|nr:MAG: hypothetical protein Ct9H90mP22_4150 [Gammaproteobacteria bacterium]
MKKISWLIYHAMVSRKENGKALFDQIMTFTLCNNFFERLSGLRPLDKWRILNLKFKLPYPKAI